MSMDATVRICYLLVMEGGIALLRYALSTLGLAARLGRRHSPDSLSRLDSRLARFLLELRLNSGGPLTASQAIATRDSLRFPSPRLLRPRPHAAPHSHL